MSYTANALAAVSIACSLGIPDAAIRRGLMAFRGDESDNPGRGNWFEHRDVRILVDFAHNAHGMAALAATVRAVGAEIGATVMQLLQDNHHICAVVGGRYIKNPLAAIRSATAAPSSSASSSCTPVSAPWNTARPHLAS